MQVQHKQERWLMHATKREILRISELLKFLVVKLGAKPTFSPFQTKPWNAACNFAMSKTTFPFCASSPFKLIICSVFFSPHNMNVNATASVGFEMRAFCPPNESVLKLLPFQSSQTQTRPIHKGGAARKIENILQPATYPQYAKFTMGLQHQRARASVPPPHSARTVQL
jgi:hypothetical protein